MGIVWYNGNMVGSDIGEVALEPGNLICSSRSLGNIEVPVYCEDDDDDEEETVDSGSSMYISFRKSNNADLSIGVLETVNNAVITGTVEEAYAKNAIYAYGNHLRVCAKSQSSVKASLSEVNPTGSMETVNEVRLSGVFEKITLCGSALVNVQLTDAFIEKLKVGGTLVLRGDSGSCSTENFVLFCQP